MSTGRGGRQGDDPMWSLPAYLGQFSFGFVAPLVVYLARRDQSPFTRFHSAQALNAALTYTIVVFGGMAVAFVSIPAKAGVVAVLAILPVTPARIDTGASHRSR